MRVMDKLIQLKNISGSNAKKDFIRRNVDDDEFVRIMHFLLNPYIVTGLSKKKIVKKLPKSPITMKDMFEVIDYLSTNNTGTDADIATVNTFIDSCDKEYHADLRELFCKEFKLGIGADGFNQAVSKEIRIPVFDCMLAKSFDDHHAKVRGNFIITTKLDGNRLISVKENGIVSFFTRQGKSVDGLNQIRHDIESLPIDNVVFDGELMADTGSFSDTMKLSRTKDVNKTNLKFHVFDMLPVSEFKQGISRDNAIKRKTDLHNLLKDSELKYIIEVPMLYIGDDKSIIDKFLEEAIANGEEGLMINRDTQYQCTRTDGLLKVKKFKTCDLKIIGFEEGTGKYKGTLGAILVDYKGGITGVGSGFSDEQRNDIWNNQDNLTGRVIEVKYFEETQDSKTGQKSIRFPVFKTIREEGKEVSYN